jgi:hypothetical protein
MLLLRGQAIGNEGLAALTKILEKGNTTGAQL